jgi:hypothetical protein
MLITNDATDAYIRRIEADNQRALREPTKPAIASFTIGPAKVKTDVPVVNSALAIINDAASAAAESREAKRAKAERRAAVARRELATIIIAGLRGEPHEDAVVKQLTKLIDELGMSPDDVKREANAIERMLKELAVIGLEKEKDEKFATAVKAFDDMVERHNREREELERVKNLAMMDASDAGYARDRLNRMLQTRGYVFSEGLLEVPHPSGPNDTQKAFQESPTEFLSRDGKIIPAYRKPNGDLMPWFSVT